MQRRAAFSGPARMALRWVYPALLRFCECRGWTDGRQDFVLFGLEPDVQMAEWLMHVVARALAHEEARYRAAPAYAAGGHALEVVNGMQPLEQVGGLSILAREFGLMATVGSDFHAPGDWSELGLYRNLPEDLSPLWRHFDHERRLPAAS